LDLLNAIINKFNKTVTCLQYLTVRLVSRAGCLDGWQGKADDMTQLKLTDQCEVSTE